MLYVGFSGNHSRLSGTGRNLNSELELWSRRRPVLDGKALTKIELDSQKNYVMTLIFNKNWAEVAHESSKVIFNGCSTNATIFFARSWIFALKSEHDVSGLLKLGKHFFKFRKQNSDFVPLSLLCFVYSGYKDFSKRITRHLLKKTLPKSVFCWEAVASFFIESGKNRLERSRGIDILKKICERTDSNYFQLSNFLRSAQELGESDLELEAAAFISKRFPLASDSYLTFAARSIEARNYSAATKFLMDGIQANPKDADIILSLGYCFEKTNDLIAASDLLMSNSSLFSNLDYDFNVTLGMVHFKLFERYESEVFRGRGIRALEIARKSASLLGLSVAPIDARLHGLKAGIGELTETRVDADYEKGRCWIWCTDSSSALLSLRKLEGEILIQVSKEAKKGDFVFFVSRRVDSGISRFSLEGLLAISGPIVFDNRLGRLAGVKIPKWLSVPVSWPLDRHRVEEIELEAQLADFRPPQGFFLELKEHDVKGIDNLLDNSVFNSDPSFKQSKTAS